MDEKRPYKIEHPNTKSTNDAPLIPETQREVVNKDEEEDESSGEKIYFDEPYLKERPISSAYPVIDTDLARDNVENDLTDADFQSL